MQNYSLTLSLSTIQPKARGLLHMECDFHRTSLYKLEFNSLSTLQPHGILEHLWRFNKMKYSTRAWISRWILQTDRGCYIRLQSTRSLSYIHIWVHLTGWTVSDTGLYTETCLTWRPRYMKAQVLVVDQECTQCNSNRLLLVGLDQYSCTLTDL